MGVSRFSQLLDRVPSFYNDFKFLEKSFQDPRLEFYIIQKKKCIEFAVHILKLSQTYFTKYWWNHEKSFQRFIETAAIAPFSC